ncbi:hypothetical protein [Bacillus cereus group sp. TH152-1LC]|uniref:hypothetical protein n=1 Tax=Bacillus cereus group sp. TH152-1LC TaxID=3018060 RepID=UPI0022DF7BEA|nr:hypothetical protein [Bacillus cereus group sp. TH152-1LC]MDA1675586.1 hypothetical protein [Bacillus cereus group sp. TH152-1LC]
MKKLSLFRIVTIAIIFMLLELTFNIAQNDMVNTGVGPANPTSVDLIKYIYHWFF